MSIFIWTKAFDTGLELVDQQHHGLVDLINRYGDSLTEGKVTNENVTKLLDQLVDYTLTHFQDEEKLMAESGIDSRHLKHHQQIHLDFTTEVREIVKELNTDDPKAAHRLHEFLTHWLAYHILGMDLSMARQLERINQGSTAEQAYADEEHLAQDSTEPLLAALNRLFEQVSARNRELAELNRTLEQKVAERTSELAEANRQLEELSLTDTLTNLPNRRHAMKRLELLWTESTDHQCALSCVMIDADHFKQVNDTYGHDKGDFVLKELAQVLLHSFRNDDIVCRLGGDEFFVICPGTDLEGAMLIAERVRTKVCAMRVPTGGEPWIGSISMGVGSRDENTADPEALIKKADKGVYAAKEAGKNCVRAA